MDYKEFDRRWIFLTAAGLHYEQLLNLERSYAREIRNCRRGLQLDRRRLLSRRLSAAYLACNAECDRHADTAAFIDITARPTRRQVQRLRRRSALRLIPNASAFLAALRRAYPGSISIAPRARP